MFERFTNRARLVLALANQEAIQLGHACVGTEHVLLALLAEGTGVAAMVLKHLGVEHARILQEREEVVLEESAAPPGFHQTLRLAIEEARGLQHDYIGTEHLLLGILRQPRCAAARILERLGLPVERVRTEILGMLGMQAPAGPEPIGDDPTVLPSDFLECLSSRARRVIERADQEARRLCHEWISTEHLLLGLIGQRESVAGNILHKRDILLDAARQAAEKLVPKGSRPSPEGLLPCTHGMRQAIEHALEEARSDEPARLVVGTEHLLLGLLREPRSIAREVLLALGHRADDLLAEVRMLLSRGHMAEREQQDNAPTACLDARARRVIEVAAQVAHRYGHSEIAPGHLLLALLKEPNGVAGKVLDRLGVEAAEAKAEVARMLRGE